MQFISLIRGAQALCAVVTLAAGMAAAADAVDVSNAWVRATVPGQSVAGAYMDITTHAPAVLVAADSPLAGRVELHQMEMDGGVMKMRPVVRIALPAHKTVQLKPGGYHLMLIDIKREIKAGERVPLALTLRTPQGVKSTVRVEAEVRSITAAAAGTTHHKH